MASLQAFVTNNGLVVVNSLALSGNTLTVTRARLGDGVIASEIEAKSLSNLIHETMEADIVGVSIKDGWHVISIRISNTKLDTDLTVNEIGLYCADPDDPEKEVMFYYATFGDKPDWIAPNSLAHYTRTYDLCLNVGLVGSVNVTISPDALVTVEEMENAMQADKLLAKIVSVSGAGCGLDSDMLDGKHANAFANKSHTHALESSELTGITPISKGGTGASSTEQAREKLGVSASGHTHDLDSPSIGSILPISKGGTGAKSAAEARSQLGAAEDGHSHAFTDDKLTGTLPIGKGGTGATTPAAARANLEITLVNLGAAASGHGHTLTDDTIAGILPISKGGTGAKTVAAARKALGLGNTAGALPVANGGTGASTAANARANLGAQADLGFTPVQQGGGSNQKSSKIYIGWSGTALKAQVDDTDLGEVVTTGDSNGAVLSIAKGGTGTTSAQGIRNVLGLGNTTGAVPVANGGTGATTAAKARENLGITLENLGAAASGHGHALTDNVITGVLPIAKGGTGATSAAAIRNALGLGNTTGAVPIANGGTGATSASAARSNLGITLANLGAAASGHGHALTDSVITGILPISKGGTGATTAAAALQKLGIQYSETEPAVVNGGIWLQPV